ncbi:hypothetical protein [Rhizobium redzepovicii]|uniref:hypothetical protein n=1 Tax=Rhizobium redzepovicii TaxID=2867518 RepID=UPI001C93263D|nr:hypothetical protein [Rhizobium redzepovicii]MBY4616145.1 hypothetical protein [Rhizobium redzepovicii]
MQDVLIERRQVVRIHLDQLERSIAPSAPREGEAIYASIALRFLMDDNALGAVANEFGIVIEIDVPDFTGTPLTQAIVFAAGGYPYGDHVTEAYYAYRASGPQSPHRRQFEENLKTSPRSPSVKTLKYTKFLATPCLGFAGEIVDRATLIRYVANKCGGAHHHSSRTKFDTIDNRLTDIGHGLRVRGDGMSVVFMETLGTAWFLLQSPGVTALRTALASGCGP